jgi:carbon-monoxide dehydrogenase small subunit
MPLSESKAASIAFKSQRDVPCNVVRAPASSVCQVLSDIPTTAACLPGAEVIEFNDHSVKGRVQIKFGPMSAAFSGAATVMRDDQKMMGTVRGAGVDGLSKTRARGELIYRVVPIVGDSEARIAVALTYSLVDPLAQFSRSGLVKDFAHRLIVEFAANLNERIAKPETPLRRRSCVSALLLFRYSGDGSSGFSDSISDRSRSCLQGSDQTNIFFKRRKSHECYSPVYRKSYSS